MTTTEATTAPRKTTKFEQAILTTLPQSLTDAGYTTEEVDEVSAFVVGEVIDHVASYIAMIALVGQATGQLGKTEVNILATLVDAIHVPQEKVTEEQLAESAAKLSEAAGVEIKPPSAASVNTAINQYPGYL